MTIYVEVSAVIDRPVAEVFRIHATEHVQNHPRWDPNIQLVQMTEGPLRIGTMIKRINSHSGTPIEGTMEIIEFQKNKSMGMIIKEGHVEIKAHAYYEAKGLDQTDVSYTFEFMGLDESEDKSTLTGRMDYAIQNHKRYIESAS